MIEIAAVVILILIVGSAITYIVKQKKKGVKCIGCPYAGSCSKQQSEEKTGCHS